MERPLSIGYISTYSEKLTERTSYRATFHSDPFPCTAEQEAIDQNLECTTLRGQLDSVLDTKI